MGLFKFRCNTGENKNRENKTPVHQPKQKMHDNNFLRNSDFNDNQFLGVSNIFPYTIMFANPYDARM
jgi:hypothetical protein